MQAETSTAGAASSSSPTALADSALPYFARGVIALLRIWPALRLAVTHNWKPAQAPAHDPEYPPQNAAEKRDRLAEELVDAYYSTYTDGKKPGKAPGKEEIEDFLLEFFEFEYGAMLEDASEAQLALDIEDVWKECMARAKGQQVPVNATQTMTLLEKFETMAQKAIEEDADPARALRGTRTGEQDDDDEEYTSDEDASDDGTDDDMEVDGQAAAPRSAASHPARAVREEAEVDDDGFTTVSSTKKGGRH